MMKQVFGVVVVAGLAVASRAQVTAALYESRFVRGNTPFRVIEFAPGQPVTIDLDEFPALPPMPVKVGRIELYPTPGQPGSRIDLPRVTILHSSLSTTPFEVILQQNADSRSHASAVFDSFGGFEAWAQGPGSAGQVRVGLWGAIEGDVTGEIRVPRITMLDVGGALRAPIRATESVRTIAAGSFAQAGWLVSDGEIREVSVDGDVALPIGNGVVSIETPADLGTLEIGGDLLGGIDVVGEMGALVVDGDIGDQSGRTPFLFFGSAGFIYTSACNAIMVVEDELKYLETTGDMNGTYIVGSFAEPFHIEPRGVRCSGTFHGRLELLTNLGAEIEIYLSTLSDQGSVNLYGDMEDGSEVFIPDMNGRLTLWGDLDEGAEIRTYEVNGDMDIGGTMDGEIRVQNHLIGQIILGFITPHQVSWNGVVRVNGDDFSDAPQADDTSPYYNTVPRRLRFPHAQVDDTNKRDGGAIGELPYRPHPKASTPEHTGFVQLDGPADSIPEVIIDHYGPVFIAPNFDGRVYQVEFFNDLATPPRWFNLSNRYHVRDRELFEGESQATRELTIEPDPDYRPSPQNGFGGTGRWRIRANPGALFCPVPHGEPVEAEYAFVDTQPGSDVDGYFSFNIAFPQPRPSDAGSDVFGWFNAPEDTDGSGTIDALDLLRALDAGRETEPSR